MSRAPEVEFRPYDSRFAADPYPVYARLRDESPVFYSAQTDLTLFARYNDVRSLVLDGRLGRSMDHLTTPKELAHRRRQAGWDRLPNYSRYVRVNLLETEGPTTRGYVDSWRRRSVRDVSGTCAIAFVRSSRVCSTSGWSRGEWTSSRI